MGELALNRDLVGQRVCNPARPEWGQGTVLNVQATTLNGQPAHRVSVQFATGHRTVVIPPGRLEPPRGEPQRESGWLDQAARRTLDDQLVELPEQIREFLGTSSQRMVVLARLYTLDEDANGLIRWARSQTGVADPLAHWSRDELRARWTSFAQRRDRLLRDTAAQLRSTSGHDGVKAALEEVPPEARRRMQAVLE